MTSTLLPLFPLPNILLYPKAILPLHVFEPRFIALVEDLKKQGRDEFALAVLKDGWDTDYFKSPPIHSVGGKAKILQCSQDDQGCFNILVQGCGRIQMEEVDVDTPYRQVSYHALEDILFLDAEEEALLRQELRQYLREFADEGLSVSPKLTTGYLTDVLLVAMNLPIENKIRLFALLDVHLRAEAVIQAMRRESTARKSFQTLPEGENQNFWN